MAWVETIFTLLTAWTAWCALALYKNYREAHNIGLPVVISPVSTLNVLWLLASVSLPVLPLLRLLPENLSRWTRYAYIGWQFDDGYKIHAELGPAFVICSPRTVEIVIADPDTAHSVLIRRKEFIKPPLNYESLNVFGPNLVSAEGETWQRHRKITTSNFNERVSKYVWSEALRQSVDVLNQWARFSESGTSDVAADSAKLALHVLTSAGLGISYSFNNAQEQLVAPHRLSYRDALSVVLRNFILLNAIPRQFMRARFMPKSIRKIGEACEEFELYMIEQIQDAKEQIGQPFEKANILSSLVRASKGAASETRHSKPTEHLREDELLGNLFIYNLAGHESTSNTVATSIAYVAAFPMWQDWVSEEIRSIVAYGTVPAHWDYIEVFPQLKRCLAVMLETLRLHGAVVSLPRTVDKYTTSLRIAGQEYLVPPKTSVSLNFQALQCDPQTWGADALQWRPDRWIQKSADGKEKILEPPEGTFVAFSDGPRVCPGKKFAQVEFAAIMAILFQSHRVRPVLHDKETPKDGQQRLVRMIEDSGVFAITLQMRNPKDVKLAWARSGHK